MSKQLLIKSDDLPSKINLLLEKVSKNDKALNEFVKNPFQVLASEMPDDIGKMTEAEISSSNKLLFAVLANDEFKNWLIKYQEEAEIGLFTEEKTIKDLSFAIIKFGNIKILEAMLKGGGIDSLRDAVTCNSRLKLINKSRGFDFVYILINVQKFRAIADAIIKNA